MDFLTYGLGVSWTGRAHLDGGAAGAVSGGLALAVVGAAVMQLVYRRGVRPDPPSVGDHRALDAFRTGAGVYAGTFLLGHNWEYCLAFLLLTIPFLVRLARRGRAIAGGAILVAIVLVLERAWWAPWVRDAAGAPTAHFAWQTLCWGVFAALVWLLADTAPPWLRRPQGREAAPDAPPPGSRYPE